MERQSRISLKNHGTKEGGKYAALLQTEELRRWLRNLEKGSKITAEVSLRRIGKASELMAMSPSKMVSEAKNRPKEFQDALEDFVSRLEEKGNAPQYIAGIMKNIRSWLSYNGITLTRRIKIRNLSSTPTIDNEQVPSQDELARIFRNSSARVRVAEALIAFGDLRPESLGTHDGSDGLQIRDLPELRIENGKVSFERIPTIIVVRPTLSKGKHKYFTFLPSEGCAYLREYLEARIRGAENLKPDTPVIGHERPTITMKMHLPTRKITGLIRKAMRKAGVYKRPYVLRAYAETQLIIAESKSKISHPYLQFIAGHKGDIEARYSTNKGRLPPEMIEGMRSAYKDCEPFLSTMSQLTEQTTVIKEAKIEALKSIAKSMFGIDLLDVKIAKEREQNKRLSQEETVELFEVEIKKLREQPDPQKVVREDELENFLREGWQFVTVLPGKKIIVKK